MTFKSALLVALMMCSVGVLATGCGNTCDEAEDKLEECGVKHGDAGECSGNVECVAECTNSASCADIKAIAAVPPVENGYSACITKCIGTK